MKMKKQLIVMASLICALLMTVSQVYAGDGGVKVGTLTIKAVPGTRHNILVHSSVDVVAVFKDNSNKEEYYIGEMGVALGADISYRAKEELGYVVFSPASDYKNGSYGLEGKYFGATASATVGAGVSAKVLLGGGDKSFTLQPVMLGGNTGVGASAGLGYLYLEKDKTKQ